MKLVEPKVFLIGETKIDRDEIKLYLNEVGAPEWQSDAPTDMEALIEIMGRLCYRSFMPGLNPNVKKVRRRNDKYLSNIIEFGHGSVLEHAFLNFILMDVSRIFTHELVRHRVGIAISQESLRFVRLKEIRFWMPNIFRKHHKAEELLRFIAEKVEEMERWQLELAELLEIDKIEEFEIKKKLTSAMRRIAPEGLTTTIGWSANIRSLRHIIEMRTHPSAEEEMRLVFGKIAERVQSRYPNLFRDYVVEIVDNLPWYKTPHNKV
jgi:thymidylate synthase (FAD)